VCYNLPCGSCKPLSNGLLKEFSFFSLYPAGESLRGGVVIQMYAIIETGGKQYRVKEGDTLNIEKLSAQEGETVEIEKVLAVGEKDNLQVGAPFVPGARVKLRVDKHGKGDKIIVFKYKPKKGYRRKQGHRQPYSRVTVEKIEV